MNKVKIFSEKNITKKDILSTNVARGHVVAYVHGTNIPLFEKDNKIIVSGSTFTAMKHFKGISIPVKTQTYNAALGLDNIVSITDTEERIDQYVYLFALGTSGCGPENSQVYDVDYTKWITAEELVPFKYQLTANDLSADMREKYFGRKAIPAADRIAYYFKAFDIDPVYKQQYIDGTPIDENVYISDNDLDVQSYVEIKMSITNKDCRDYFLATSGINDARVNTISLLTAIPKEVNGYTYYQNIRPLTRLNFPNISLIDEDTAVDIIYQIFY